jgi:ATP phosphoribosyltransferase
MHDYLVSTFFGETLDKNALRKSIDGSSVLKVWKEKKNIKRREVDLLNFYIDPTAEDIQSAYRVTERALLYESAVKGTDWINKDAFVTAEGLNPNDGYIKSPKSDSNVKTRDTWSMYGKIPEYLITGDSEDTEEIDGIIVVSGLEAGGATVHAVRRNTTKDKFGNIIKPYEEDHYIKVPGRWLGKGVAEKLLVLQTWMNAIINIRINRSYVAQLGLFKIRKGANITPDQISRLGSNGAVVVNNMDDIEQMAMTEASQASYTDESNIHNIAQRITSAFEAVTGEQMPASTPATNAVLQNRNATSIFTNVQERTGFFVQRLIDRHLMPKMAEIVEVGDVIKYMGHDNKFDKMIERAAVFIVRDQYAKSRSQGLFPSREQVQAEIERVKASLREKKDLFMNVTRKILADSLDTYVVTTNEALDVAVRIDKLTTALQMAPEYKQWIIPSIYDLMGMPIPDGMAEQPITLPNSSLMMSANGQPVGGLPSQRTQIPSPSQNNAQSTISSLTGM